MFVVAGSKIQPLTVLLALALLGAMVVSAFRISRMAPHYGRRRAVWFFISLFFTAIPATIVFWRDYARSVSARETLPSLGRRLKKTRSTSSEAPPERCRHCGVFFTPTSDNSRVCDDDNNGDSSNRTVIKKCPNCGMKPDGKHLA